MNLQGVAAEILEVEPSRADGLIELRKGARTIGLYATPPDIGHAFGEGRQVLVKIYGDLYPPTGRTLFQKADYIGHRYVEIDKPGR